MKPSELYYTALFFVGSKCLVLPEESSVNEEPQYIEYHDEEYNVTRVIDLQDTPYYSMLQRSSQTSNILYLLYTRSNPNTPQYLVLNDANSIASSNYEPARAQTVVLVHGWGGNQNSAFNPTIRDAYLDAMDVNIIVLDWSSVSTSNYMTAVLGTPDAGRALGQFLAFLQNTVGDSYSSIHLIGFSLGAHVVGNAGGYLGGQVERITGLDPAGPLWGPLNMNRLSAANAKYVEAIHTDRSLLGTSLRSGDTDFYPNGGNQQPGCSSKSSCSHNRSWQLYAATLTYNHLVGRKCSGEVTMALNLCFGDYLYMGNGELDKRGNGQYRLNTASAYPYNQTY